MKYFILTMIAIALLATSGQAAFKNVVCAKTLGENFESLSIGDCVKTDSGFTVQLISLQKSPDAATFRTFTPEGDPLKDVDLSNKGQTNQLDQEAFIGYGSVVSTGSYEQVQAEIRSFDYLFGGKTIANFQQPAKDIKPARIGDTFELPAGLKITLNKASGNIAEFTLKTALTTRSLTLTSGQPYVDANLRMHVFSITQATGGQTQVALGIKELSGERTKILEPTVIGDGSHGVKTGVIIKASNDYAIRLDRVIKTSTGEVSISFTAFTPFGDEITRGTLSLNDNMNVGGVLQLAFINTPTTGSNPAVIQVTSLVGDNTKSNPSTSATASPSIQATTLPPQPTTSAKATVTVTDELTRPTLVTPQDEKQSPIVAFVDAIFAYIRGLFGSP